MTVDPTEDWDLDAAVRYADALMTGDRVRLRGVREADLDRLASWRSAPASEVLQSDSVNPGTDSMVRDRVRAHASDGGSSPRRGFSVETIDTAEHPPELVGLVTLSSITLQHRSAEFAVALDPASGGRGYGLDATRLMVRYGFRELGLHRIHLKAWAFNERALRTYRRAGFVQEGRLRDAVFHDGRWHDEIVMSILSDDSGTA